MKISTLIALLIAVTFLPCARMDVKQEGSAKQDFVKGQFSFDLNFLKKNHPDLVLLGQDNTAAQLRVSLKTHFIKSHVMIYLILV